MKNILLWAGIGFLVFKDQLFPKKTTRQQQFLQTGGTTQAFIGEVNDEFILLLKKLFKVKLLPKSSPAYNLVNDCYYFETKIYIVNKGIKDNKRAA